MRALILTNEFPPSIYGGAGVHVDELTRHLRALVELDIRTFGSQADDEPGWRVRGYPVEHNLDASDERLRPDALGAVRATSRWSPIRSGPMSCTPTPGTPTSPGC